MEIKRGISQMAEYPNVEINYVVPKSGNMYYLLKNGELSNGVIIATLDPRHAIDEANESNTVGAFSENGDTLIDFDKKKITVINDDLLLAVNSKPVSDEVIDALSKQNDEISKTAIMDNAKQIEENLKNEMGDDGEIIFSDPFSEVNVYMTDSYNNKLGLDCSFVGKDKEGLYFHTNEVNSDTKIVKYDFSSSDDADEVKTEEVPVEDVNEMVDSSNDSNEDSTEETDNVEEVNEATTDELKLDISSPVVDGFEVSEDELNNISLEEVKGMVNEMPEVTEEENNEEKEEQSSEDEDVTEEIEDDQVVDNAIEVLNKMIKETNKLNEKIKELEDIIDEQKDELSKKSKEIENKNKIIETQEKKFNELNNVLNKANQVLENIE